MKSFAICITASLLACHCLAASTHTQSENVPSAATVVGLLKSVLGGYRVTTEAGPIYPVPTSSGGVKLSSLQASSAGGVREYYPLHEGDWKDYSGEYGADRHTFSQAVFAGNSVFKECCPLMGSSLYLQYAGNQLLWYGGSSSLGSLQFNTPLVLMDDSILARGGSRTSRSTLTFQGITIDLTLKATITLVGNVAVPAGSFAECCLLRFDLTASAFGEQESIGANAWQLAPGAGRVKSAVLNGSFEVIGWQELTAGMVGGQRVGAQPPQIISYPQSQTVTVGATVEFTVEATGTGPLHYQWRFDGADIPVATNASLVMNSVRSADAGPYSVLVSNAAGSVPSFPAILTVTSPPPNDLRLAPVGHLPDGSFVLTVSGTVNTNLVVQSSVDLVHWAVCTNVVRTGTTMRVLDANALAADHRFYKAILNSGNSTGDGNPDHGTQK
jgi:hypothetical protein